VLDDELADTFTTVDIIVECLRVPEAVECHTSFLSSFQCKCVGCLYEITLDISIICGVI
jgi:hypothetical protein